MAGLPGNVSSYNIAPGESADAASARRKMAMMLMMQGMETSPIQHWTQGAARVAQSLMGGWELSRMDAKEQEEKAQERAAIPSAIIDPNANMPQGDAVPQTPTIRPASRRVAEALYSGPGANGWQVADVNGQRIASIDAQGKDIPSPLDPPDPKTKALLAALVQAEAGNQGPVGQQAVANVVRNRAAETGLTIPQVIAQRGQFEPVSKGRLGNYGPGTPGYDNAAAATERAYTGADPTAGAVNFYAPNAQAQLAAKDGRPPVARFDNGAGIDIQDQRYFTRANGASPPDAVSAQSRTTAPAAEPPLALRPGSPEALTSSGGMTADMLRVKVDQLMKQGKVGAAMAQDLVKKWNESQLIPTEAQKTAQFIRQNWQQLGFKGPDDPDLAAFARQKLSGLTTPPGETEQEKKIGAYYGDLYKKIGDDAAKARTSIATYRTMDQIMKDPNFRSGLGATQETFFKRAIAAFGGDKALIDLGMDPKKAAPNEAFAALSSKSVYDTLGTLGTAVSDGDRSFVEGMFPNLLKTPAGNAAIIKIQERMEQRKLEIAQAARGHNNGRLDANFENKLDRIAQKPLFSNDEIREIQGAASEQPTAKPQTNAAQPGSVSEGATATNPKTGEKIMFKGGQWVPVR